MGQTTRTSPVIERIRRALGSHPRIVLGLKRLVDRGVDLVARLQGFSFPPKYTWDWKWEMLRGRYEPETTQFFRSIITPGMTILDVGAHIGYFTRLFSACAGPTGRIYAIEADPGIQALLKHNIRTNANVTIVPVALSDRTGSIDFYESLDHTGFHSLIPSPQRTNRITVQTTTLDTLVSDLHLKRIDLIKMDIEGAEPLALEGAVRLLQTNARLKIVLEFCPEHLHLSHVDPAAFIQGLQRKGFTISTIRPQGLEPFPTDDEAIRTYVDTISSVNIFASREGHGATTSRMS